MPRLKVCGVNDAAFAVEAASLGVDYLGFIFAEGSPRRVTPEKAREIMGAVRNGGSSGRPRYVGVFTDRNVERICRIALEVGVDVVQLHSEYGAEEVSRVKALGFEVWRLAPSEHGAEKSAAGVVDAGEDAVLLDGRSGTRCGGTGVLADWSRVAELKRLGRRVVLAGGISAANIAAAAATGADVIDVNSGIETAPGVKSVELLSELLAAFAGHKNQAMT